MPSCNWSHLLSIRKFFLFPPCIPCCLVSGHMKDHTEWVFKLLGSSGDSWLPAPILPCHTRGNYFLYGKLLLPLMHSGKYLSLRLPGGLESYVRTTTVVE